MQANLSGRGDCTLGFLIHLFTYLPIHYSPVSQEVCPAGKTPYGAAASPRISNTQLAFRIEILSSVLDLLHAHRTSPLSLTA